MSAEEDNTSTVTEEPDDFDSKSTDQSPGREDFGKLLYGYPSSLSLFHFLFFINLFPAITFYFLHLIFLWRI